MCSMLNRFLQEKMFVILKFRFRNVRKEMPNENVVMQIKTIKSKFFG